MIEVGGEKIREGKGGGGLMVVERVKEKGKKREEGESRGTEGEGKQITNLMQLAIVAYYVYICESEHLHT